MKNILILIQFVFLSSSAQNIYAFAGNGTPGFSGDGGPAIVAQLQTPMGSVVSPTGDIYITDSNNNRIRKVAISGIISTIAGSGFATWSGDGFPAVSASINNPSGIAVDVMGNIYFSDSGNQRIRKINTLGIISTIGGSGVTGYSGDGGSALSASMNNPLGLCVDGTGNVYFADSYNNCVRKISSTGTITTIVGNGLTGFSGDGGLAINAQLSGPEAVTMDSGGNIYIADSFNHRVRKINTLGIINTIAGNGGAGFSGDGSAANLAQIKEPTSVVFDGIGNTYISSNSARIRIINSMGIINTFCGTGIVGNSGNGGPANLAQISIPSGLTTDASNNLFFCDNYFNGVRIICSTSCPVGTGLQSNGTNEQNFEAFPNPVSSVLHFSIAENIFENAEIEIKNILGQIILKLPFKNEIDVSQLSSGCYSLKITTADKQQYHSKVIKD